MPQTATNSSVTEGLADILARPVGSAHLERASLHLVDWLGSALIGLESETGAILSADLRAQFLGPGKGLDDPGSEMLAFSLGSLGSLLEMDDLHKAALLHPGPVVIPAAIAAARPEVQGADLLAAIVRGYEAMIRLGVAVGPSHYAFYHNTGTCGGFGSAAAAAAIAGLDRKALVHALGIAGSVSGGLWQCRNEPVASKPYHVAEAARRGVAAARLAARGLTAPRFILEGPQGLFKAQAPGGNPADVIRDPERDWAIGETSFKPWPACRHAHPVIDAALAIRDRIGGVPDHDISDATVETYSDSVLFCDRPAPVTELQAKFSLQHAVAVCLLRGRPTLADFTREAIADPALSAMRARVAVIADDAFSSAYPARFGARLTLRFADGRCDSQTVADAWGDPENPMSRAAIIDKAEALIAASRLDGTQTRRIIDAALSLADGGSISDLRRALDAVRIPVFRKH